MQSLVVGAEADCRGDSRGLGGPSMQHQPSVTSGFQPRTWLPGGLLKCPSDAVLSETALLPSKCTEKPPPKPCLFAWGGLPLKSQLPWQPHVPVLVERNCHNRHRPGLPERATPLCNLDSTCLEEKCHSLVTSPTLTKAPFTS